MGQKKRGTIITDAPQEKEEWEDQRKIMCRWPPTEVFTKDEVASPTAATESVFITATIDAFENRDVLAHQRRPK